MQNVEIYSLNKKDTVNQPTVVPPPANVVYVANQARPYFGNQPQSIRW